MFYYSSFNSPATLLWFKLQMLKHACRSKILTLGLYAVHMPAGLHTSSPYILKAAGEELACRSCDSLHRYCCRFEKGEAVIRCGLVKSRQVRGICTKHSKALAQLLESTSDTMIHDRHRQYQYVARYKDAHTCRQSARCSHEVQRVETFVFFDELWGDGRDIVVHKLHDESSQWKRSNAKVRKHN